MILSDLIPLKRRGTFQGYMNIVFATGTSLGAPVGGFMADVFGWRWSFGIQIPLIVVSTLIVMFRFHLPHREITSEPMKEKLKRVDFVGALTLVIHLPFAVNVDLVRFVFDPWNEPWRERITVDTSSCSHNSPAFCGIFYRIPHSGREIRE